MSDLLRVYLDPNEIGPDGYPYAWRKTTPPVALLHEPAPLPPIKNFIREQAGFRCERCQHPYPPSITDTCPRGEWTPCDEQCTHDGPVRVVVPGMLQAWTDGDDRLAYPLDGKQALANGHEVYAQWRILTTHHLNGIKHDCRWWNLAALCQRCHLTIQGKVYLDRPWNKPHSEWFKPHAAGYYASVEFEDSEPSREWVLKNMEDILSVHATQGTLL